MLERIEEFKKRIDADGKEFCEELFNRATIRLMAHKYAYYVHSQIFVTDDAYDIEEKSWYVMGRALEHLTEDETTPCIDFDATHPKANDGIKLANTLVYKKVI